MKTLLVFVLAGAALFAQVDQGTITGTVTDQTGALAPGVKMSARHVQTGITAETRSNTEGHYTIPYLSPGQYDVTAESDGFKKARVTGVNLTVGLIATVDLALEVGAVQNEVTVEASAVQLEQQSSALGAVVGSSQMLELPLLGRNPYSLALLAPGVLPKGGSGSAGPIYQRRAFQHERDSARRRRIAQQHHQRHQLHAAARGGAGIQDHHQ